VAEPNQADVTLNTLHDDLRDLKDGLADVKTTLITGFRSLPTRESSEEMVRLLRDGNRLNEERFTRLDLRIREQHFEIQQILHGIAHGVRGIADGIRGIADGIRTLLEGQQALHEDIRALIARLDALIKGRGDGSPTP
jgi:hypothetical protein